MSVEQARGVTMDDKLIVGQRHRDAAVAWIAGNGGDLPIEAGIKRGENDNHPLVQAFARFERDHMPAAVGGGWIVGSGDGKQFRTRRDGWSAWTENRDEATRYARREDAEAVHREDQDAWTIVPYATPTPVLAAVEVRATLYGEHDYTKDPEGLERIRASLKNVVDWHDMATFINCNSLARLLDTIERLRGERDAALTNAQPIRAGLTQRAMMQRIDEAIRMLDWCIENHYAPDSSREVAAVAGLREVKKALPAALATPDDALTARASVIERALRIYPEWCQNWGLDSNLRVATTAAIECAEMLAVLPVSLPEDDEKAGCVIATAIRALLTRAPGQGEGK